MSCWKGGVKGHVIRFVNSHIVSRIQYSIEILQILKDDFLCIIQHFLHSEPRASLVPRLNTLFVLEKGSLGSRLDNCSIEYNCQLYINYNVQRNVVLSWQLRVDIAKQIADALHFLHTVNLPTCLVHGDVKRWVLKG